MISSLKAMVVVLTIAWIVFRLARPLCLRFMSPEDFSRRRLTWFGLTCAGFLAPTLWIYAAVALPLSYWAGSRDQHPTALYLLVLLTVPPAQLPIPMPVINQLFELGTYRILAITILFPAAMRLLAAGNGNAPQLTKADAVVLAWGALQLVLYMPYENVTNTLRRAFLYGLDTYLLYYVFSRATITKAALRDTLASFCLACVVLALVAVFEAAKGWLLYIDIPARWGVPNEFAWLFRADSLRAQASGGHSLITGYLFAIGFGLWLYIAGFLQSKKLLWGGAVLMWAGLFAAAGRAPWVVGAAILVAYLILSPSGRRNLVRAATALAVLAVPFGMTSYGAKIFDLLPFVGSAEQDNVDYRQQVATVSWRLIKQHPFFGDPSALSQMEELRQGQGIIDLVNTYASISVFYGLVGCTLFVLCFAYPLLRTALVLPSVAAVDTDGADLGGALAACMAGTLLMLATCSFGMGFEVLTWALAGMCSAYTAAMHTSLQAQQAAFVNERAPRARSSLHGAG